MQRWKVRVCALLALITVVGATSAQVSSAGSKPTAAHYGWAISDDNES
jgi:hypothetical protein